MSTQVQATRVSGFRPSRRARTTSISFRLMALSGGGIFAKGPEKPKSPATPAASQTKAAAPTAASHELTATDLEAFLDGLVPAQIEADDIAGTVISVVKDG